MKSQQYVGKYSQTLIEDMKIIHWLLALKKKVKWQEIVQAKILPGRSKVLNHSEDLNFSYHIQTKLQFWSKIDLNIIFIPLNKIINKEAVEKMVLKVLFLCRQSASPSDNYFYNFIISFSSYEQPIRISNFYNEIFVYLLFWVLRCCKVFLTFFF